MTYEDSRMECQMLHCHDHAAVVDEYGFMMCAHCWEEWCYVRDNQPETLTTKALRAFKWGTWFGAAKNL